MQVKIGSRIRITDPTDEIMDWCRDNLILANPEYAKKLRMHFWVGNTPSHLFLFEMDGNDLLIPFGCLRDILPFIEGSPIRTVFGNAARVDYRANVPLYDYQKTAVDALVADYYGILQSPAGSGKTQMGIAVIARMGVKTLWLTHTKDLLNQSKSRAEIYIDKSLLGTITEGKVSIGTGITFATIQTMCRLNLAQYKYTWDLIIVDECHRCTGTPTAVTQFYKVLNSLSARNKYGLSATVHRSDGLIKATYALLGNIVYSVPREEVEDKIMQVGIKPVGTPVKLTHECLNTDGTLCYTKLITHLCTSPERNQLIARCIADNADHPALILSDRLNHLKDLMNLLPLTMRLKAVMVDGKMTSKQGKADRERAIEDMRTGRKKYLFATYSLAKEGLDIPCLERLFMATPQKDYTVITQSIGRIARISDGKQAPICYDFVDDIRYLFKAYKKRCATYKKSDCYFVEDN